jgi:hypothetical protein
VNPLAELCRQIGCDAAYLVRATRLSAGDVAGALAEPQPACSAGELLACLTAVGASIRLPPVDPPTFWIETAVIDEKLTDHAYRRARGLLAMPTIKGELRRIATDLRDAGWTAGRIGRMFEQSVIPTPTGLLEWHQEEAPGRWWRVENLLLHADRGRAHDDGEPLDLSSALPRWRGRVAEDVLANLSAVDPIAAVRWGYAFREEGDRFIFSTQAKRIPAAARRWILDSLAQAHWTEGRWGLLEPRPAGPASPGTPPRA